MRPPHVIVGVDGSPHSRLALRWAADEAAHRGAALRVVPPPARMISSWSVTARDRN
jgi:nucleotide-binding universal stress UspA family protein